MEASNEVVNGAKARAVRSDKGKRRAKSAKDPVIIVNVVIDALHGMSKDDIDRILATAGEFYQLDKLEK